ncbi:MAG: biopolymer transporter ExbD [Chromatiaceae bacterium]|jgi:biopolymer transport protein ExbD|nr:biopolymer transporter ExbD [Chromatiaceae bacterium]
MKRIDSINVIPFIDIMLVLLAIVLTTATFIVEGRLDIRLPESESQNPSTPEDRVELAVDKDGKIFLDAAPISLPELQNHLARLATETPILLRVDADARFAGFVSVVDLLKAQGLDKLTILTRKPGT